MKRLSTLFSAMILLALAGCADGKPSEANKARLQKGVTTFDQALALLGKPYHVESRAGRVRAIWVYTNANGTRGGVFAVFNDGGVVEEID